MALNYIILPQSSGGNGPTNSLPAPVLRHDGGERALAHGTPSGNIVGPCEIRIVADEDCWLDVALSTGALDTATTPLKLIANTPEIYSILPGTWKIQSAAA